MHLLQAFPDVAEHYRRRFRHVLVDEYQDTNHAQYMLVRELVGTGEGPVPMAELCVVGDADQSIYAFRGATIRNIDEFERDYPQATTILLEQNYRSTQRILRAANTVIAKNTSRRPKNLWTDAGDGELIEGYVAENEHDEAAWVAEQIDALVDEGKAQPKEIAIFYRTNNASRVFEEVFIRVGMPYKVVGGVRFYERKEVRDALAYLKVVANPADVVSLRRVINTPKRGIGERAEACIEQYADRERIPFASALRLCSEVPSLATRSLKAIQEFVALLEEFEQLVETGSGPAALLESILDRTGYLTELSASTDPQDEGRVDNLNELISVAAEFEAAQPRGHGHRLPRAGVAGGRRRPDPGRRRRGRRRHADDAAHRQGAGVPGRLPDRPGGRRLPAPAGPRRPAGAGGGAAAGLRRDHAGAAAAVPVPRDGAHQLGPAGLQPAVPVPRRAARRHGALGEPRADARAEHRLQPGLLVGADRGWRPPGCRPAGCAAAWATGRSSRSRWGTGSATTRSAWAPSSRSTASATRPRRRSTSAAAAPSASSCATPRSSSCDDRTALAPRPLATLAAAPLARGPPPSHPSRSPPGPTRARPSRGGSLDLDAALGEVVLGVDPPAVLPPRWIS